LNKNKVRFFAAAVLCLSLTLSACTEEPAAGQDPDVQRLENAAPQRVLFVGNSYLYYNDSLHNHVERIAEEFGPHGAGDYEFKSATIGGARLSHHPVGKLLQPGRLGVTQPFELVILQGGSMEPLTPDSRAAFRERAIELNEKIRATGAEVALYMTHAYIEPDERYQPDLIDKIAPTYVSVGNEIGALVIPVGLAFERAYAQRPDIVLHKTFDGSHPSLLGTYLGACVVYQSIYGRSPVGVGYDYFGAIDRDDAAFLQKVAAETVREFFGRD
jgi:hypothetical protein